MASEPALSASAVRSEAPIGRIEVAAYTVPTDAPESDGTLEWDSTTLVVVHVSAGGTTGLGYTYADAAAARLVRDKLAPVLEGQDAFAIAACWEAMVRAIRNLGRPGLCSMAIAAVDAALWDLKGRLLALPVATLLGPLRRRVPVYGSGGFTSYGLERLQSQLAGWVEQGIPRVKMKVGRAPLEDPERVRAARQAIGPDAELFVDANGAYDRKQALRLAERFAEARVSWLEEPVSSDDLPGLALVRERAPAGVEISAGEYGYDRFYFLRMLAAGAVDVLQADATRCAGVTGFLEAAGLSAACNVPFSSHCAPLLHLHPCCSAQAVRHMEYFHDHVRIESMLFDASAGLEAGALSPDWSRPGLGIDLKRADAARYAQ